MTQGSKGSGLRLIEVALVAGAAVIGALVLFAVLRAVVGVVWEIIKFGVLVAIVIGVIALILKLRK